MSSSDKHLLEVFQDIEKRDRAEALGAVSGGGGRREELPEPSELRPPADRRLWHEIVACVAAFALGMLTDRLLFGGVGDDERAGVSHAADAGALSPEALSPETLSPGNEQGEYEGTRPAYEPAPSGVGSSQAREPEAGGGAAPLDSSLSDSSPSDSALSDSALLDSALLDSALFDPANEYVVQVATYNDGQGQLAQSTYEFLLGEGLPAFSPQRVGGNLVLLVGAKPARAELVAIQDRVHRMSGPTGTPREFSSAYIVRKAQLGIR